MNSARTAPSRLLRPCLLVLATVAVACFGAVFADKLGFISMASEDLDRLRILPLGDRVIALEETSKSIADRVERLEDSSLVQIGALSRDQVWSEYLQTRGISVTRDALAATFYPLPSAGNKPIGIVGNTLTRYHTREAHADTDIFAHDQGQILNHEEWPDANGHPIVGLECSGAGLHCVWTNKAVFFGHDDARHTEQLFAVPPEDQSFIAGASYDGKSVAVVARSARLYLRDSANVISALELPSLKAGADLRASAKVNGDYWVVVSSGNVWLGKGDQHTSVQFDASRAGILSDGSVWMGSRNEFRVLAADATCLHSWRWDDGVVVVEAAREGSVVFVLHNNRVYRYLHGLGVFDIVYSGEKAQVIDGVYTSWNGGRLLMRTSRGYLVRVL